MQAYLDVLPASFSTPLTWRDEELAHLQFAPFIDELRVERSYFAYEVEHSKALGKAVSKAVSKATRRLRDLQFSRRALKSSGSSAPTSHALVA